MLQQALGDKRRKELHGPGSARQGGVEGRVCDRGVKCVLSESVPDAWVVWGVHTIPAGWGRVLHTHTESGGWTHTHHTGVWADFQAVLQIGAFVGSHQ